MHYSLTGVPLTLPNTREEAGMVVVGGGGGEWEGCGEWGGGGGGGEGMGEWGRGGGWGVKGALG